MPGTVRLAITSAAIISLASILILGIPSNTSAQVTGPQFSELSTKVASIVQDSQAAVTNWNNNYFAGSLKELELELNPGIASSGNYSTLISGASLQTKELPYYGPTGLPTL